MFPLKYIVLISAAAEHLVIINKKEFKEVTGDTTQELVIDLMLVCVIVLS